MNFFAVLAKLLIMIPIGVVEKKKDTRGAQCRDAPGTFRKQNMVGEANLKVRF